jgi:hypothetical protein
VSDIISGGSGANGKVSVHGKDDTALVELLAFDKESVIGVGNKNRPGRLTMYNGAATPIQNVNLTAVDATLVLGGSENGKISVLAKDGKEAIRLDAATGDITLSGADCAEDFEILGTEKIDPGTVMVIQQDGVLEPSRQAYDKRVAGVISGAGSYHPGIVLGKQQSQNNSVAIALVGRAYCKVDAEYASIEVGDLLTTSCTPGHAMKADHTLQAFGAVIGKALRPLAAGQGLIPILITLQ